MGKKYIIELPEKYILEGDNGSKYLQIPVADSNRELIIRSTMPLTPYTEPDTEAIEKEAYQRGLNDAWEAAKKNYLPEDHGGLLGYKTRMKVFGTDNIGWIFKNLSASEAIEKIRAYEEKKKAEQEIKVGDEVSAEDGYAKFYATWKSDNCICGIDDIGKCYSYKLHEIDGKTGRCNPEIAKVLKEPE